MMVPIIELLFSSNRGSTVIGSKNYKLDPRLIDVSKIQKPSIMQSIENVMIHIEGFVTYEEVRFFDELLALLKIREPGKRLNLIMSSNKII
jgi:hypothetical protein